MPADVPFDARDLRGVRQVGRPDVRRGETVSCDGTPTPWRGAGSSSRRTTPEPRRRGRRAARARPVRSTRCRSWSAPEAPRPAAQCRRSASISGAIPLLRMKAITTSMRSDDSISDRSWFHKFGSPRALVSRVVSSSGIRGCGIGADVPSGAGGPGSLRAPFPGRSAVICASISATISRASATPRTTRLSSGRSASARAINRPRCSAMRSAASAGSRASRLACARASSRRSRSSSTSVISVS
jgi:hypothetical protein